MAQHLPNDGLGILGRAADGDVGEGGVAAAPASVPATGNAFPGRSRPVCLYPQYAHYNGSGDPESAASFACRE